MSKKGRFFNILIKIKYKSIHHDNVFYNEKQILKLDYENVENCFYTAFICFKFYFKCRLNFYKKYYFLLHIIIIVNNKSKTNKNKLYK